MIRSSLSPVLCGQAGEDFTTLKCILVQWKWNPQSHWAPKLKSKFLGMAPQDLESLGHAPTKALTCFPPFLLAPSERQPSKSETTTDFIGLTPHPLPSWPLPTSLHFTSIPDHCSLPGTVVMAPDASVTLSFPPHSAQPVMNCLLP